MTLETYFMKSSSKPSKNQDTILTSSSSLKTMEIEADNNNNTNEDMNSTLSSISLSYILRGEFFEITNKSTDSRITAQCKNCPKTINGSRTSTGNFFSHYNRVHPHLMQKIKSKRLENKKTTEQQKIQSMALFTRNRSVSIKQIHSLILNYIIEEMRPLNTIYKPAFRNLICGIANDTSQNILPGKSALSTEINKLYKEKKFRLKSLLEKQNYICLTSDIWSCKNKSYLGMTIHFISESLERKSYTLSCKRIRYNHTYKNIALIIHHILKELTLDVAKITHIITDNATNFGKVFRCFGVTRFENSNRIQFNIEENEDILSDMEELDSDIEINEFDKTSPKNNIYHDHDNALTDELGDEIILPPQITCCSHTLNLIATTECKKILDNPGNATLKKIYRSVFAKLSALWNLLSRSTVASDICLKECNCKFPVPVITRWNSQFDAIQKLLTHKTKLNVLFEQLKLQKLRVDEIEFLEEFVMIMCPLATSLDILQGEKMCFLGLVAPTIIILKQKLLNFTHLSYCKPLIDGMIVALEKRFKHIYDFNCPDSKLYIISAISLPRFKLNWVPECHMDICKELFLKEVDTFHAKNTSLVVNKSTSSSSGEEDFFYAIDKKDGMRCSVQPILSSNIEALSYLESKTKDLDSLNYYPNIKNIFLKYNTTLPSSAPVERLFSCGQQIFLPRRNRLSDNTFEKLLFLKNKNL